MQAGVGQYLVGLGPESAEAGRALVGVVLRLDASDQTWLGAEANAMSSDVGLALASFGPDFVLVEITQTSSE